MATTRVVVNSAGVRDILRSKEVMHELESIGKRIAAAAGKGYEVQTYVGKNRDRVTVRTATDDARLIEATKHNLLRALAGESGGSFYTSKAGKTSVRSAKEIANYTRNKRG